MLGAAELSVAVSSTAVRPAAIPDSRSPICFVRRTSIPDRRAASSASPVKIMWSPRRVCFSRKAAISAAPAVQRISAGTPSRLPRPRARKFGSQRPTKATPPVIAKARPLATDAVARVAISDGILSRVTSTPLSVPAAAPTASPPATASAGG